MWVSSIFMSIK